MAKQQTRTEVDSLGKVNVPKDAYYGAFTTRAQANFQISGQSAPMQFMSALGQVKLAACQSNQKLGLLKAKPAKAIAKACKEFIDGAYKVEFLVDVYQAGAGTSYNMNANEIIANRADEILGGKKGTYEYVHPNNHVNMGQSTNDVIPAASRVAILGMVPELLKETKKTITTFNKLAAKHKKLLKVGRTHLQDAVPVTLGQEFEAYSQALAKSEAHIQAASKALLTIGLGGTAAGTGINTDPQYQKLVTANLSKITGLKLKAAKSNMEIANNMNAFLEFSGSLRALTTNLLNISSDLKLMGSGPKAGLGEVELPPVQPGSSIMPGKINPSILECLDMICFRALGNDQSVSLAAQRSHFQLNVYCPLIVVSLIESVTILTNGLNMFRELCLKDLKVNKKHISQTFDNSLATGTALAPYLGYLQTAEVIKLALKEGTTIKAQVLKKGLLSEKKLNKILDPNRLTKPAKQL